MRRTIQIAAMLAVFALPAFAQDVAYVKQVVHTLASPEMAGRGYQHEGDRKAAAFIREEFIRLGLQPVNGDYYQPVVFPVNSITGRTVCRVDGKELVPGQDYFISARSKGVDKEFRLVWLSHKTAKSPRKLMRFAGKDHTQALIVIDPEIAADKELNDLYQLLYWSNPFKAAGIVRLAEKPGWHISDSGKETEYIVLSVRKEILTSTSKKVRLIFTNQFEKSYRSNNVIAMVPGTRFPDSFIVFTAHYDHLGMMGEVMIPGANDNASGTAMILDLARHYSQHPAPFSLAFMAFTAEETGLTGSRAYTENPLFPLGKIRLLINFDMVGTGSDGITLVNGSVFEPDFNLLDSLNRADSLLKQVKIRGESANSDHHPFYEKGVKAFFIYTMGDEFREYHNIHDRAETLPFTAYEPLFRLITRFTGQYM